MSDKPVYETAEYKQWAKDNKKIIYDRCQVCGEYVYDHVLPHEVFNRDAEIIRLTAQLTAAQYERDAARESRRRLVGLVRGYRATMETATQTLEVATVKMNAVRDALAAQGTEAQP